MQVPERLALIGGSILLSSLLIFALKSQASQILPKIEHPISSIYDHAGDAQKSSEFDDNFEQAQKNGWTTGTWGTSKYYIDKDSNLHIGAGQLQGKMAEAIDRGKISNLKTINIDQSVQAPQDSSYLLSPVTDRLQDTNKSITNINGLYNLNTNKAQNMTNMFANYANIQNLDVSSLDTSNVRSMLMMFNNDTNLQNISGMEHWNTSENQSTGYMFYNVPATTLDLSNFDTSNVYDFGGMYLNTNNLRQLTLGDKTIKGGTSSSNLDPNSTWKNNGQVLTSGQLQQNDSTHPGTWVKQ